MAHEHSDNCPECLAFRDKSEAELRQQFAQVFEFSKKQAAEIGRVHVENAGLRDEIERLDKENEAFRQLNDRLNDGIRELRAKRAEQERK